MRRPLDNRGKLSRHQGRGSAQILAFETKLRPQPCGISLAKQLIALIVERCNNISFHRSGNLTFSFIAIVHRARCTPNVDLPSGIRALVNRFANLGNYGPQGQPLELDHSLLDCPRARSNRNAYGYGRSQPAHADGKRGAQHEKAPGVRRWSPTASARCSTTTHHGVRAGDAGKPPQRASTMMP